MAAALCDLDAGSRVRDIDGDLSEKDSGFDPPVIYIADEEVHMLGAGARRATAHLKPSCFQGVHDDLGDICYDSEPLPVMIQNKKDRVRTTIRLGNRCGGGTCASDAEEQCSEEQGLYESYSHGETPLYGCL